jgi:beta-aspartyl-peptidase (threonine type)
VQQALTEARAVLASGARAIDVVEAVVAGMENSGVFNAGKGAIANKAGVVEMDASIMEGRLHKAGAVASVKAVRNPISAARLVMDETRHVMLVGPDADRFVREKGGTVVDVAYFLYGGQNFENVPLPEDIAVAPPSDSLTPEKAAFSGTWAGQGVINHVLVVEEIDPDGAKVIYGMGPNPFYGAGQYRRLKGVFLDGGLKVREPSELGGYTTIYRLNPDGTLTARSTAPGKAPEERTLRRYTIPQKEHGGGTVGAVVRDRCGDLAAGTSTGGFGSKTPGRVGDSPIIGAGTYADNETAAISATGHGELFMRHVVAYAITAAMKYKGLSLEKAATGLIKHELPAKGLRGGVIAVDRDGNVTMPYNTEGMVRGTTSNDLAPVVEVY